MTPIFLDGMKCPGLNTSLCCAAVPLLVSCKTVKEQIPLRPIRQLLMDQELTLNLRGRVMQHGNISFNPTAKLIKELDLSTMGEKDYDHPSYLTILHSKENIHLIQVLLITISPVLAISL